MSQPNGAEVLLDILNGYGVEAIFSSPGSEWPPLWEALARRQAAKQPAPAYYNARHEDLAIGQAMGYARATGRLGVCLVHATVGTLHASMGIRAAYHEQIPLLVLAGESVSFRRGAGRLGRRAVGALSGRPRRAGAAGRFVHQVELRPEHADRAGRRRAPRLRAGDGRAAGAGVPVAAVRASAPAGGAAGADALCLPGHAAAGSRAACAGRRLAEGGQKPADHRRERLPHGGRSGAPGAAGRAPGCRRGGGPASRVS